MAESSFDELDIKSMDDLELKSFENVFPSNEYAAYSDLSTVISPRTLKSIYQTEDWVFIPIDRIAAKLSQIPWQVHRVGVRDGEQLFEPALDHPVQQALENPNPLQSAYDFKYALITDHCVTGNALIYMSSVQRWLVQVPTEIIRMDIATSGGLLGYDVIGVDPNSFPASMRTKLRPQDVIHVKRPNSSSVYWGLSPLIPGGNPALFNKYSNEYLINFYRKGAQPGIVLQMEQEANEAQAKKLLASLETSYTGRANQRRGLVLPKGVKATNIAHTLSDQQLIEYIRNNRETILNIFQVPLHELSLQQAGSLGSEETKMALKNFWQGPLMSIGGMFESALTQRLKSWLGNGYVIKLNYSNVPILQEDLREKADTANAMLAIMTPNEVRKRVFKMPPIEGGDTLRGAVTFPPTSATAPSDTNSDEPIAGNETQAETEKIAKISMNGAQVSSLVAVVQAVAQGQLPRETGVSIIEISFGLTREQVEKILGPVGDGFTPPIAETDTETTTETPNPEEPEEQEPEPETEQLAVDPSDYRKANFEAFQNYVKSADNPWFQESQERLEQEAKKSTTKLQGVWMTLLMDQIVDAVKIFKDEYGQKSDEDKKKRIRKRIEEANDKLEKPWSKDFVSTLSGQMELGYDSVLEIPFNRPYQEGIDAIRARNKEKRRETLEARGLDSFHQVSRTTTEKIMQAIENGLDESASIAKIADDIREIAKLSVSRALTIARQETLTANSLGEAAAREDAAEVIPRLVKVWINANDDRVRGRPGGLYEDSEADHWSLLGEIVDHDAEFSNGLRYPRDTKGEAGEVIGCRCTVLTLSENDLPQIGLKR